jgi:hypothetical protein
LLLDALNGSASALRLVAVYPDGVDVEGEPVRRLAFPRRPQ